MRGLKITLSRSFHKCFLYIQLLRLGKMQDFLQKAMQPPDLKAIDNAIKSLFQMVSFQ